MNLKGVVLTRSFVDFVVHNKFAIEFWNWLKQSNIPDEHFYSTLITVDQKALELSLEEV